MKFEQVYVPYWDWEDWKAGMWSKIPKDQEIDMLVKAIEFTGNHKLYGAAMERVASAWVNTMINNLTNMSINPRAFVGHCACMFEFGCPEYITRAAWKELTWQQQKMADEVAQLTVDRWRKNYARKNSAICRNLDQEMLFP